MYYFIKLKNMKIRTVVVTILMGWFVSCSSNDQFLAEDPRGQLFPESFFNNATEVDLFVTSVYKDITYVFTAYHERLDFLLAGNDGLTSLLSEELSQVETFSVSEGNTGIKLAWDRAWKPIKTANAFLKNYRRAEDSMTEKDLNCAAAEAHFGRAFIYFWLVRLFNGIPLITEENNDVSYTIGRASPEEIYALIVEDLKFAEEWLPVNWDNHPTRSLAGFTKGAAKSMLASVYLTMAGYPVNGGTEYYRLAAEKAKEVIDHEAEYGYRLLDNFADLWMNRPLINDEVIYAIIYGREDWDDWHDRVPLAGRPTGMGGWDHYAAEINFFNKFPAGPRKDATFVTVFKFQDGSEVKWEDMPLRHPYYAKEWIDRDDFSWDRMWEFDDWYSDRSQWVIRYPEVLLTYAEAQARAAGTPDALAYQCMKRVRERAGITTPLPENLNGAAFADSVFVERGWEFAGNEYCSRWFDLQRLELVEDAAKAIPQNAFLPGRHAWELSIPIAPTKKSYFMPIPTDEVLLNPNLKND
jgi:hypothetical protein